VLTQAETFGATGTRTTTTGYDADERPLTQTITVTGTGMGAAVPRDPNRLLRQLRSDH
jgi:hypothetical protein